MILKHAGSYYVGAPANRCDDWFAAHYERGVTTRKEVVANILSVNPSFVPYTYHSLFDNYQNHPEETQYAVIAQSLGVDPEAVYLHYDEETEIEVWGGTRIVYPAGARVEVYNGGHQNASWRAACSFLPEIQPVHIGYLRWFMGQDAQALHRGIALDNCAPSFWNWGTRLIRGGTVREAGVLVSNLHDWHWANLRPTLVAIKDVLNGFGIHVAINVASRWIDDYLTSPTPANDICLESIGNPIKDHYPDPHVVWRRHQKANLAGVRLWTLGNVTTGDGNGSVSWDTMLHGHLCYALFMAHELSHFHVQNWTGPNIPDWETTIWPKAIGQYTEMLGQPTGQEPYVYNRGTTRGGYPYAVWQRNFERGTVLLRLRYPYNGPVLDEVRFDRPRQMFLVDEYGNAVKSDQFSIPNGGGAILVRA